MHIFRDIPRWVFLLALIYAPWAYGCTTAAGIVGLNWILGGVLILWIAESVFKGVLPVVPPLLVVIGGALTVMGWWIVLNARAVYDSAYSVFIPLQVAFPWGSGSVDQTISAAWMVRGTMLIGVTFFVADLSQRPAWLTRLWWTVGIAGGSIALLGLLQKASGAEMIFWQRSQARDVSPFFATYYYHANAGAFLNLVLPLAVGLAFRSLVKRNSPVVRAVWLNAALIILLAVLANTSRMAQLIGVLLILAIAFGPARSLMHMAKRAEKLTLATGAIVVILAIVAIGHAIHLDQPLHRWNELSARIPKDARWLATTASLPAIRDAGWFGFGPGTFRVIFPHYLKQIGAEDKGGWRFLHQDYLQTVLEWGRIGAALWSVYFFGGIVIAIRNLRSSRAAEWTPRYRSFLPLALLALAGVALHALVDFPLQIASLQLYVATYLGVCWGSGKWGESGVTSKRRKSE